LSFDETVTTVEGGLWPRKAAREVDARRSFAVEFIARRSAISTVQSDYERSVATFSAVAFGKKVQCDGNKKRKLALSFLPLDISPPRRTPLVRVTEDLSKVPVRE
jgi:hypothetical protein